MLNITKATRHAFERFCQRGRIRIRTLVDEKKAWEDLLAKANDGFPVISPRGDGSSCYQNQNLKFVVAPTDKGEGIVVTVLEA